MKKSPHRPRRVQPSQPAMTLSAILFVPHQREQPPSDELISRRLKAEEGAGHKRRSPPQLPKIKMSTMKSYTHQSDVREKGTFLSTRLVDQNQLREQDLESLKKWDQCASVMNVEITIPLNLFYHHCPPVTEKKAEPEEFQVLDSLSREGTPERNGTSPIPWHERAPTPPTSNMRRNSLPTKSKLNNMKPPRKEDLRRRLERPSRGPPSRNPRWKSRGSSTFTRKSAPSYATAAERPNRGPVVKPRPTHSRPERT